MTTFALLLGGFLGLVAGSELLVRGAVRLAAAMKISPLVIGLTIVAFGTSAPELAVSVSSALAGQPDLAVGNVIGSNIFNTLLILGLSALIVPLVVHQKLIVFDVPIMVGVSILLLLFAQDQQISRFEGAGLFAGIILYTVWCVIAGRRESAAVRKEYSVEYSDETPASSTESLRHRLLRMAGYLGLVAAGAALLVLGSNWMVEGAVEVARWLGVSELVIGLTVIAAGTSLPEAATSVMAAVRNERDIAVGNAVGSNLFNIMSVLGLTAVVAPKGLAVSSEALRFDLPVMVVAAILCVPIFVTGRQISRSNGAVLLCGYVVYVSVLVFQATWGTGG
ncbi:MAG: calcium/sodium antiporter [Planctomycetaceae bacterium]